MPHYDFSRGSWDLSQLTYAYPTVHRETPQFVQEDGAIVNRACPELHQEYDLISLVSRETYGPGTLLTAECSFDRYGAPLLLIARQLSPGPEGELRYFDYYEVVLWENGINVWQLNNDGQDRHIHACLKAEFPVSAGEYHTLSAELQADCMNILLDGKHRLQLRLDMPERFHVGICACEGINRFRSMTVEEAIPQRSCYRKATCDLPLAKPE